MHCFEKEGFPLYFVFDDHFVVAAFSFPSPLCDFVDCMMRFENAFALFWNTVLCHIFSKNVHSISNNISEQLRKTRLSTLISQFA